MKSLTHCSVSAMSPSLGIPRASPPPPFHLSILFPQIARQQQQLLQQQHKINLLQQQIQVSDCVSVGPLTLSSLHSDCYYISTSLV